MSGKKGDQQRKAKNENNHKSGFQIHLRRLSQNRGSVQRERRRRGDQEGEAEVNAPDPNIL